VNSTVPTLNISQQCGASSTCYSTITNPDGSTSTIEVPCNADANYNPADVANQQQTNYNNALLIRNIKIALVVAGVLLTLLVFYWWVSTAPPPVVMKEGGGMEVIPPAVVTPAEPVAPVVAVTPPLDAEPSFVIESGESGGNMLVGEVATPTVSDINAMFAPAM
jgi:hypothetical protein